MKVYSMKSIESLRRGQNQFFNDQGGIVWALIVLGGLVTVLSLYSINQRADSTHAESVIGSGSVDKETLSTQQIPEISPPSRLSTYGNQLLLPADAVETAAMARHDPTTRAGRLRRAWTVDAVRNDPGRIWLANRLAELRLPTELAAEIGNIAWEQQELRRVHAQHPGIPDAAVDIVGKCLLDRRFSELTKAGFPSLQSVAEELSEAPVQGYVQLARPVVLDAPSGEPFPEFEDLEPGDRTSYGPAMQLAESFPNVFHRIQAWLDHLGYSRNSRAFLIGQIAHDLRNIWVAGGFASDFPIDDYGAKRLPSSILGPEPPSDRWGGPSGAWLYRKMCIQYLKNHGGPADDRFYDDIYSIGLAY
ncbi:MAG: hypothetical protein ACKOET_16435 [Verrucomicrobiota bacterium]